MAKLMRIAALSAAVVLAGCGGDTTNDTPEPELAPHPAPAAPNLRQWTAPRLLENSPGSASSPIVATDNDGNAIALWAQYGAVPRSLYAAHYDSVTGLWNANQLISSGTGTVDATPVYDDFLAAPRIQLAFSATGNALAVWTETSGAGAQLWFNTYDAEGGEWGVARLVIDQTDVPAQIPDPNATPSTDPTAPTPMIDNPAYLTGTSSHPALALNADGNGLLVWVQSAASKHRVRAASFDAENEAWREHGQDLDDDILIEDYTHTRLFSYPKIVMDNQGNAVAAWTKRLGAGTPSPTYDVVARQFAAANAGAAPEAPIVWTDAVTIDAADGEASHVNLAADESGNVIALWTQFDGTRYRIYANATTTAAGAWGSATLLEASTSGDHFAPRLTMNAAGDAIAWWSRADHIALPTMTTFTQRYRNASGWNAPADAQTLPGYGSHPLLQLTADDFALAVWNTGEGYTVHALQNGNEPWGPAVPIAGLNDARDHAMAQSANGRAFSVWTFEDTRDVRNVYVSEFE